MPRDHEEQSAPELNSSELSSPFAPPQIEAPARNASGSIVLASLWSRFFGALIDVLTMTPGGIVIVSVVSGLAAGGVFGRNTVVTIACAGFTMAALTTLWFAVMNGLLLSTRGQTLGKATARTRIVSATTNDLVPVGPLIAHRWFAFLLIALIPFVGTLILLVDIMMIFQPSRRCLHDEFAGTKVINAH